jgi:hypothetical protein
VYRVYEIYKFIDYFYNVVSLHCNSFQHVKLLTSSKCGREVEKEKCNKEIFNWKIAFFFVFFLFHKSLAIFMLL